MKIMKFEGSNMREAVAKVKAELGDQAVIVSTRQIRRGLLGTACEISAAIDDDDTVPTPKLSRAQTIGSASAYKDGPQTRSVGNSEVDEARDASLDLERAIGPLRGELKALRNLIKAASLDARGTNDLREEVASLRRLVEQLNTPPPTAPAKGTAPIVKAPLTAASTGNVLMLVGPTGVGKTTTIAKLAARAALIEGKRVKLLTLDNYRVGGIDQIRTFADLIGVPLGILESPAELADAIDANDELTLIDTAGRSPRDANAIRELANGMRNAPPIEVHIALAASSTATMVEEIANRYRSLSPSRLLFTKLDEIDEAPELSRAPARLNLPITWVTTGQAVPEDIEEPTTQRVLELAASGLQLALRSTSAA